MAAKKKKATSTAKPNIQVQVSAEALPRRTLEDSLPVARVIRDSYAGKAATWKEIATALQVSPNHPSNKYPLWSGVAYGIVVKSENNTYALGETGRKILAPTYDGEREEGIKKALFTPSVLSRFYTDYNGSPLPGPELLPNVLETRYDVPRGAPRRPLICLRPTRATHQPYLRATTAKRNCDFQMWHSRLRSPRPLRTLIVQTTLLGRPTRRTATRNRRRNGRKPASSLRPLAPTIVSSVSTPTLS